MNSLRSFVVAVLLATASTLLAQEDTNTFGGDPGTMRWSFRFRGVPLTPALSADEQTLYVTTTDGFLYAFPTDFEDQSEQNTPRWVLRLGGTTGSSPIIGEEGEIYVALNAGVILKITDAETNGVAQRLYYNRSTIKGTPALGADGTIYFSSRNVMLTGLFPDGGVRFAHTGARSYSGAPVVDDDTIYIGAGNSLFGITDEGSEASSFAGRTLFSTLPAIGEDGTVYVGSLDDMVYALRQGTGTNGVRFRINTRANVFSSPAIGADGRVYVGSDSRRLFSISTNGAVLWSFPTRGAIRSSPSIGADGTIYFGADDRRLYAVSHEGEKRWDFVTRGPVRSSAVIGKDGTVYITSADRNVYAIWDYATAEETPWPMFRGNAQLTARSTNGMPYIISQPEDTTVKLGDTATFTVKATAGAALGYQWQHDGEDIPVSENRTANSSTLVIRDAQLSDAGDYTVIVTNSFGELTSDSAHLEVSSAPVIITDLTNRFVSAGTTLVLSVGVEGDTPMTNQWYFNGTLIEGAMNPTLVISNVQPANSGEYSAVFGNALGEAHSRTVTVTVVQIALSRATNEGIAAGNRISSAIVSNQLFTWGADVSGQLGDGGTTNRNFPARVGSNTTWQVVTAGGRGAAGGSNAVVGHMLALQADGSLFAWGSNNKGQLGINSTNDQRTPVLVLADTNWIQVEAGAAHTVALKHDGTIWTWGGNDYGQLGHGTTNRELVPTIVGDDSAWVEVRAGGDYTLARRADGTIWGWGRNDSGQLGLATTFNVRVPTQIGTNTDWKTVSAGVNHSLGLRTDGTLWFWGRNYGITDNRIETATNVFRAPINVVSNRTWVAIDAGADHSVAIDSEGHLFAWGANNVGQLGNNQVPPSSATNIYNSVVPVSIGGSRTWSAIQAGVKHSLARATDGTVWAWGWNNAGQVGNGAGGDGTDAFNQRVPVQLVFTNFAVPPPPTNGAPAIVLQPVSVTNLTGASASFSVLAGGSAPLAYQWRFNGGVLSGATNSSYSLANIQAQNVGGYDVVITNALGSITSSIASLVITNSTGAAITNSGAPVITTQPANVSGPYGTNVAFSVIAVGPAPLSYQWRLGSNVIVGATNSVLTISNAQPPNAGRYDVVVTNSFGSVTSSVATLNFSGGTPADGLGAPIILQQPVGTNVAVGSQVTFTVGVTGAVPFVVRWHFATNTLPGATNTSLALTNVQTNSTGDYFAIVSNSFGMVTSALARLEVTNSSVVVTGVPPGIVDQPTNSSVAAGGSVTFSLTVTGTAPLSIQWGFATNTLPGATNTSLVLTNVQTNSTGDYFAIVSNSFGVVTSALAHLEVTNSSVVVTAAPPGILDQSTNRSVIAGSSVTLSMTLTGTAPLSIQWRFQTNAITDATNTTLTLTNVQQTNGGIYDFVVTNAYGAVTSAPITLTVTSLVPPTPALASPEAATLALSIAQRESNGVLMRVDAPQGAVLEYKDALSGAEWLPLWTNGAAGPTNFVAPSAAAPSRFYRLRLP